MNKGSLATPIVGVLALMGSILAANWATSGEHRKGLDPPRMNYSDSGSGSMDNTNSTLSQPGIDNITDGSAFKNIAINDSGTFSKKTMEFNLAGKNRLGGCEGALGNELWCFLWETNGTEINGGAGADQNQVDSWRNLHQHYVRSRGSCAAAAAGRAHRWVKNDNGIPSCTAGGPSNDASGCSGHAAFCTYCDRIRISDPGGNVDPDDGFQYAEAVWECNSGTNSGNWSCIDSGGGTGAFGCDCGANSLGDECDPVPQR